MATTTGTFSATVEWAGSTDSESYNRDHVIKFKGRTLEGSAPGSFGGDDNRPNPEQMFTAAIAQCQMLTYLSMAAKSGLDVVGYTDQAESTADKQDGKMRVVRVDLRPQITLGPGGDAAKAEALVEKAHGFCFIANSARSEVVINPSVIVR